MCHKTSRYQTVEVVTKNGQLQFNLPEDSNLKYAMAIYAVEAFMVGEWSVSPSGLNNVADAVFNKAQLSLVTNDGTERINRLPLSRLNVARNAGKNLELDVPPLNISKCYISVPPGTALVDGTAFILGFHYA